MAWDEQSYFLQVLDFCFYFKYKTINTSVLFIVPANYVDLRPKASILTVCSKCIYESLVELARTIHFWD